MDDELPAACSDALRRHLRPGLFRALADPTRLALVARLAAAAEPLTVTEVADCCGTHLSGVSRHLSKLERAGVVRAERSGREVRYRLEVAALAGALRGLAEAIEASETAQDCCPVPLKGAQDGTSRRA